MSVASARPCGRCLRSHVCVSRAGGWLRILSPWLVVMWLAAPIHAQTIDDGIMLEKNSLYVGDAYSHDTWDLYWEGTLKRDNGNVGTVTTRANAVFGNYGLTDRLNVIVSAPYVWTRASQGVLHGMQGFQDVTVAAKYAVLDKSSTRFGTVRAIAVAAAGIPLTDYTPDFAPLSIGSASKRLSGRVTMHVRSRPGWYVNGSTAYTWRAGVALDRPYYFTDGELFFTDQVDMPNVFDYVVTSGYLKRHFNAGFSFSQQRTLGGGDIRRQDMPFVSNRMNFARVGAMAMVAIPGIRNVSVQFAYGYTVRGRNVGQATTMTGGVAYTLPFRARRTK